MTSLRPITRDDRALQRRLFESARPDLASLPLPPNERDALIAMQLLARDRDWEHRYGSEGHFAIVINNSEDVVGEIWIHRSESELRLVDIALLPEHRRHGRGTELIQKLIEEARAKNIPLRLSVIPSNPARRLYERLGFKSTAQQQQQQQQQHDVYEEMELRS